MQRLKIARETHDLIASRARGGFNSQRSRHLPDGVEIEIRPSLVQYLLTLHPDPDLALRKLLLGPRLAVH
jgi:hypothetical protein